MSVIDFAARCDLCRSPLTGRGCLNADCGNWQGPPCNLTGHVKECPGKAGGDHELEPGWILYADEDGFEIAVEVVGR